MTNPPSPPFELSGTVYNCSRGATAATLTVMNLRTGQEMTKATDSSGHYLFNLSEFTSGWNNRDRWEIYARNSDGQKMWYIFETLTTDSDKTIDIYLHDLSSKDTMTHGGGSRAVYIKNTSVIVGTAQASSIVMPPMPAAEYKAFNIHVANKSATAATFYVYGSIDPPNAAVFTKNPSKPPSDPTDTEFWFPLGETSGYSVGATTGVAYYPGHDVVNGVLTPRVRFVMATAVTASGTATLQVRFSAVGGE